jgi:hypothetical protein
MFSDEANDFESETLASLRMIGEKPKLQMRHFQSEIDITSKQIAGVIECPGD